jgi:hypothetical protein
VLDVVINKPFKDHLQQIYNDWLLRGNPWPYSDSETEEAINI